MGKIAFTKKQNELMRLFKQSRLPRLTVLQGSVRSGKTWISLILWAFWVASRPKEYLYMMCAKSLQTLKRNCLFPLQELIGEKHFTFSLSTKEGVLFGRKIMLEGANDARSEGKIRGITLGGAYCDELTLFPKDFFTMLLSRLSAPGAKLFATTNPDVPTHWLKKEYLDNENLADDLLSVFFSIDDNTTLPQEYVESLKKEYTGVFFDRFILGKWVVAEGAIYRVFTDNIPAFAAPEELPRLDIINVGIDWGGNGSAHAMVATGMTSDFGKLIAVRSERVPATGITPQQIYKRVYEFCEYIQKHYGAIADIYADSAEQTLIAGLREELKPLGVTVKNSLKRPINDRIKATTMLMGGERFFLTPECGTLVEAFQGAVYDDKVIGEDVRLDNGTSDIDTLDAFEYSFERYIPRLIRRD
ncbi:MAG: PBSX family phage terminase large subunit [Oscillospiraceae bacterium]|nr:PBSX family phage terminase large subunit [Oscillospiraceae bacterium]